MQSLLAINAKRLHKIAPVIGFLTIFICYFIPLYKNGNLVPIPPIIPGKTPHFQTITYNGWDIFQQELFIITDNIHKHILYSFQIADIIGDILFLISSAALVILLIMIIATPKSTQKLAQYYLIALTFNYISNPIGMTNIFPGIFAHRFASFVLTTFGYWIMEGGYLIMMAGYFFLQKAILPQSGIETVNITIPTYFSAIPKWLYRVFIAIGMIAVIVCIFFPLFIYNNETYTSMYYIQLEIGYVFNIYHNNFINYYIIAYSTEDILFIITSVLLPIFFIILAIRKPTTLGKRIFLTSLIINYLTNPIAWQLFILIFNLQSLPAYWVIEGGYALMLLGYFFIPKPHIPLSQPAEESA